MNVELTELPNGLRVISSSLPQVESVTLGAWVGVGSRYEPKSISGVSHFIEHLLFKGTRKRSSREITQAIEGRGGYLNAFTQEESTCYYSRVVADQLDNAIDVLSDMVRNPRFDPVEIDKERGVIIEEIMMYRDQPQHVVHEMLTDALWKNHPLGIPIIGSERTLKHATRPRIIDFKERHYVPGNMLIAMAGKLTHKQCVSASRRLLGRARQRPVRSCQKVTRRVSQVPIAVQTKEIEQTHLAMGFRLFGRRDKRRYTLRILNTVLGENMSSRLFQVVREKHGLAYSVHSSCHLFKETGALVISAGLDKRRTEKAVALILKEIKKLVDKPVGAQELKRAKDYVVGQLLLGLESTTHQMMWLGDNIISHGRFIPPKQVAEQLSAVTAADVQQLARTVFKRSRASLAMVSPNLSDEDQPRYRSMLHRSL